MGTAPNPITGRCMCGSVTYETTAEPEMVAVCHCVDCQRQTGSNYTVVVGFPAEEVTLNGDSLAMFATTGTDHGTPTRRTFCSACGSPIITHSDQYGGLAFIKVGTLDDQSWIKPAVEIWCSSKQPWAPHLEGTTRYERDMT